MAWMVWWAWSQFTWAGNAVDLDNHPTRLALLGATGLALLAAAAIPDAFADGGLRFALPYAAVRLVGLGIYWYGLRDEPEHQAALRTFIPIAVLSPALIVAGGALGPAARPWVWSAAVAIDIASALSAGRGEFRISPTHFAERHALIVIIALGESVVAAGATLADRGGDAAATAVTVAAFASIAALWWLYFDRFTEAVQGALGRLVDHRDRSHLARDAYTFGHFPVVVGVVLYAVGIEEAILHPDAPLPPFARVAVVAGLGAFLVGLVVVAARAGTTRAGGGLRRLAAGAAAAAAGIALAVGITAGEAATAVAALASVLLLAAATWTALTTVPHPRS